MSGVYIPGMKMPKNGFITITVTSDGRVVGNSKKEYGKFEYLDNRDIAKAVPVPDHGRLIDADKMLDRPVTVAQVRDRYFLMPINYVEEVRAAPTVIPADEEAEE